MKTQLKLLITGSLLILIAIILPSFEVIPQSERIETHRVKNAILLPPDLNFVQVYCSEPAFFQTNVSGEFVLHPSHQGVGGNLPTLTPVNFGPNPGVSNSVPDGLSDITVFFGDDNEHEVTISGGGINSQTADGSYAIGFQDIAVGAGLTVQVDW